MVNETLTYNLCLKATDDNDIPIIAKIADALGSETRLKILKYISLFNRPVEISDISKNLSISKTTLLHHLKKLENAQIIIFLYSSGKHGTVKKVARSLHSVHIQLITQEEVKNEQSTLSFDTQSAKVGAFSDFEGDNFNFVTDKKFFQSNNDDCYMPERYDAELIFTSKGVITYKFSNIIARTCAVKELTFSLEICSEAPFYDMDYKSDITFWINGNELFTYTLDGDYGDRRGRLTPSWWPDVNTQYGKLLAVTISDNGVMLNGKPIPSTKKLSDLKLKHGNCIELKFGNKSTALNAGGFNLFGAGFGDHSQDIKLSLCYEKKK